MKRLLLATALIILAAGCTSKTPNNPSPTPTPTPTANPVFTAVLLPSNEVPPVGAPESSAQGTVRIELFITRDGAGTISTCNATFTVTLTSFPAGSAINIAHIHQAPVGQNAGILVNTGLTAGEVTLTNGAGGFTKANVNVTTPSICQGLIDGPAGYYFNVHTALNPSGAIRGQLTKIQ